MRHHPRITSIRLKTTDNTLGLPIMNVAVKTLEIHHNHKSPCFDEKLERDGRITAPID